MTVHVIFIDLSLRIYIFDIAAAEKDLNVTHMESLLLAILLRINYKYVL